MFYNSLIVVSRCFIGESESFAVRISGHGFLYSFFAAVFVLVDTLDVFWAVTTTLCWAIFKRPELQYIRMKLLTVFVVVVDKFCLTVEIWILFLCSVIL
jgi:hypothetical protein